MSATKSDPKLPLPLAEDVLRRGKEQRDILGALHRALAFDQLLAGREQPVPNDPAEVFKKLDGELGALEKEVEKRRKEEGGKPPKTEPSEPKPTNPDEPKGPKGETEPQPKPKGGVIESVLLPESKTDGGESSGKKKKS
jgi:hypothetical protein